MNNETEQTGAQKLLDALIEREHLNNDAALARKIGVRAPQISRIRHGVAGVSAGMLIQMYDTTGMSLDELRKIAGIPKAKSKDKIIKRNGRPRTATGQQTGA